MTEKTTEEMMEAMTGRSHPFEEIELDGMRIARLTRLELLEYIFDELGSGRGLHLVTANIDILRRYRVDERARELYRAADIRVADGMPLVWASRLMGRALPERVAGSELLAGIAEGAAYYEHPLFLIGGAEGVAERAADLIEMRYPGARVVGVDDGYFDDPPSEEATSRLIERIRDRRARIVIVALGSPKQEALASALRSGLDDVFIVGLGASLSFLTGHLPQAPRVLRRAGLEWLFRLASEPRRLARRYLIDGIPFALRLLWLSLRRP